MVWQNYQEYLSDNEDNSEYWAIEKCKRKGNLSAANNPFVIIHRVKWKELKSRRRYILDTSTCTFWNTCVHEQKIQVLCALFSIIAYLYGGNGTCIFCPYIICNSSVIWFDWFFNWFPISLYSIVLIIIKVIFT